MSVPAVGVGISGRLWLGFELFEARNVCLRRTIAFSLSAEAFSLDYAIMQVLGRGHYSQGCA